MRRLSASFSTADCSCAFCSRYSSDGSGSTTKNIWYEKTRGQDGDQPLVHAQDDPAERGVPERQRERTRNAAGRDDAEAALLEQAPERGEREQPRVRQIEDAALAVVELADEQHQPVDDEPDVRGADEQRRLRREA